MRVALLCKRYYTNRDLIDDRFGRLFHLPIQLKKLGHPGIVVAADYRNRRSLRTEIEDVPFVALPLSLMALPKFVANAYAEIKRFRPDVVLASGDIHFGAIGYAIARRLGRPFAFDVYDDYSAFASRKIPGMGHVFEYVLRKADLVITASSPLAQYVESYNTTVTVVENGIDPTVFKSLNKVAAREALGIDTDKLVIGFFGSIAAKRGVEILIQAVERLLPTLPKMSLLLAGTNTLQLDLGRSFIDFRGMVPQKTVPTLINACDVVVIPYLHDRQVDMSNACKIAEYVACGVPIVTTRVSNFAEIFAAAPQAVCEPNDCLSMAAAILKQLDDPQQLPVKQDYSWAALAARLSRALDHMVVTRSLDRCTKAER